jgi:predicted subunit of tRNA(5-methylaminomethyl-2-thiouridylate) methyltransferase
MPSPYLNRVIHVHPGARRDEKVVRLRRTESDSRNHVQGSEYAGLLKGAPIALLRSYAARRLGLALGLRFDV